jgi:hypothetical protein
MRAVAGLPNLKPREPVLNPEKPRTLYHSH